MINVSLDEIAQKIRNSATDYYERERAVRAFRHACEEGGLNPALEAAGRCVLLVNPLNP